MKIPPSSSIILATLAISSSSASLAAPTGDGTAEGGISQMKGHADPVHHASQVMENEERDSGNANLQGQNLPSIVGGVVAHIPVLGPLLGNLLSPKDPSAQATDPDPAEVERLQNAADIVAGIVSSALTATLPVGVPGAVPTSLLQFDSGATPSESPSDAGPSPSAPTPAAAGDPTDGGSSFLISPTTTVANAEEATPTSQDSGYLSSAPASGTDTPASPGVPAGPPNTPNPVGSAPDSA